MTRQVPTWLALVACTGSLVLGAVAFTGRGAQAQDKKPTAEPPAKEYTYLPEGYSEVHFPSRAEWQALQFTAICAGGSGLTDYFSRKQAVCKPFPGHLDLYVDLLPRPLWKHSLPGGKFSAPVAQVKPAILEATKISLGDLRGFFPEIKENDIRVRIAIEGDSVGVFEKGKLTLNAEKQ